MIGKSQFSNYFCNRLLLFLIFTNKWKEEINQENDRRIDEQICPTLKSEKSPNRRENTRKKRKDNQSSPDTKKYKNMKQMKSLSSRDIERRYQDDNPGDKEEKFEKIHNRERILWV